MKFGSITTGIIADGLIFNMDAANRASYVPDATTSYNTTDISNTGSFSDSGMYSSVNEGIWVFDGVDDYINCGDPSLFDLSYLTFSAWINGSAIGSWRRIVSLGRSSGGIGWGMAFQGTNSHGWWNDGIETVKKSSQSLSNDVWYNTVMTIESGTTINMYTDGTLTNGTSPGTGWGSTNNNFEIGRKSGGGQLWVGNMGPIQIYNRALSANEVLHNYNALKDRFGL
jgi:hypothetical protein